jgi:flagellar biosynthesis/type III secretory pathway protein FliH
MIKQLIIEELEAVLLEMTRTEVYKHGETKGYREGYKAGVQAGIKQALKFIQAYKTAEKGIKSE